MKLTKTKMIYIQPLNQYKFNLKSKKLEGLARLVKLEIPTVSNLFIVSPKLFLEFQKYHRLTENVINELRLVFNSIKQQGDSVTLRNSIFEEHNPGIAFCVHNSLNINEFNDLLNKIILGYKKVIRSAYNPEQVEFSYLIQSFYSSAKVGILLSDNGNKQIYLQAIPGQHTNLILRGDMEPDEYLIAKKTYKIVSKKISQKLFTIKKLTTGIKKIRVKKEEENVSTLTDDQVIKIAKLSQKLERAFGPQEIECAVLDSGKIIFQETRDFSQSKKVKFFKKIEVVFPSEVEGKVINLSQLPKHKIITDKIIITRNLNINFINKVAFLYRPKAVILTKGSLTCHAATILRESKITTLIGKNISLEDGEKIRISKEGEVHRL